MKLTAYRARAAGLAGFVLLFCAVTTAGALPQGLSLSQMVMDQWNDRSGLPSNNVLDVLQDRKGYIWLASYDGLIRFDGRTFSIYTRESRNGFDSNSARVLAEAKDGTLWIGTNTDGLFSCKDGHFKRFGKEEGLPDLSIRALGFDTFDRLWVGTAGGLAVAEGDSFRFFAQGEGISTFLLPLADGSMLTGSNKPGLWKTGTQGLEAWPEGARRSGTEAEAFGTQSFTSGLIDNRNRLWLGTASGTILVVRGNEVVQTRNIPELAGGTIKDFISDSDGTLWIASDKGLHYGDLEGFHSYSESNGLPNNSVTSLWQDREGSLWAGTDRGGIVKFSPGKFMNLSTREGLKGNAVNTVIEDTQGSLWVGSDQGLSFFPSRTDSYGTDPKRKAAVDQVLEKLGSVRIRQIRLDPKGRLWFATYSDLGLAMFDGTTLSSLSTTQGLPINRVRQSIHDSRGRLWVGTTAGLWQADDNRIYSRKDGLRSEFILDIHEDMRGRIWLGLDGGGLARINPDGSIQGWTSADGLAGNVVFRIFTDEDNRLWICTSDGLSLVTDEGSFRTFRTTNGLLSDSIYQILQDPLTGNFWLITSRGIAVMDPAMLVDLPEGGSINRDKVRVLNRLDGLAGQPASNSWAYISRMGVYYFPTVGGLSVYNPQSVVLNPTPPPVYIEGLTIDGKATEVPGDTQARIVIQPGTQRLNIHFTALSFMIPQKVGFRYQLEGYDKDFIQAPGERSAVFTNLPPGDYRFKVQAWNNDGVINEGGASILLRVEPFFWQTPLFLVLAALGLLGLGYLSTIVRMRAMESRRQELERLVSLRTVDLNMEKQRSETLLLNVLPPHVANELKESGRAESKVHEGVSVYVADLVGFTEKSSRLSPAQTIGELNTIFGAFDEIMDRHGCERIKTIGDAYLAVARLPLGGDRDTERDDAVRLARAALETLEWLAQYRKTAIMPWEVRIGMNTGPLVGGVVGIKKYIFDIFGDTVNTAFRMQTEAEPGAIMITTAMAHILASQFDLECKGMTEVKGKGSMELWQLLGGPKSRA